MPKVLAPGQEKRVNRTFTLEKEVLDWLLKRAEEDRVNVSQFLNELVVKEKNNGK